MSETSTDSAIASLDYESPPRNTRFWLRTHSTEVGFLISLAGGILIGGLFYVVVISLLRNTRFGQIFVDRGWVTVAESLLASWAICFMLFKAHHIRRERGFMRDDLIPPSPKIITEPQEIRAVVQHLDSLAPSLGSSVLFRRIRQAVLLYARHPSRAAVSDQLSSHAIVDANRTDSSYSMLRVMIWAIPIVGFIGTVVGLGGAVGGFAESLPKADDFEKLKGLLGGVTSGLSIAFDATFVALLISLLLMFPASLLEKRENDLMSSIDEYCHHEVLARLADKGASPENTIAELRKHIEESLRSQQEAFIGWWVKTNEKLAEGLSAPVKAIVEASGALGVVVEKMRASVENSAGHVERMTANLAKGVEHAGAITECLAVARGEAENIKSSIAAAAVASRDLYTNVQSARQSTQEIAKDAAAAQKHASDSKESAAQIQRHLADSGLRLKADLDAALRAVQLHHAGEMRTQLGEFSTRTANLNQAVQQMHAFMESIAKLSAATNGKEH